MALCHPAARDCVKMRYWLKAKLASSMGIDIICLIMVFLRKPLKKEKIVCSPPPLKTWASQ